MLELPRIFPSYARIYRTLSQEAADGRLGVCAKVSCDMAGDPYEGNRASHVVIVLWPRDKCRNLQGKNEIKATMVLRVSYTS